MRQKSSRRAFVGMTAAATSLPARAQPAGRVTGFDHVALPMQNTEAILAFYRALGFDVNEGAQACAVYIGQQMINFHRPALWQRGSKDEEMAFEARSKPWWVRNRRGTDAAPEVVAKRLARSC